MKTGFVWDYLDKCRAKSLDFMDLEDTTYTPSTLASLPPEMIDHVFRCVLHVGH